jgi:3-oxoacyl-[acyl-carrier protein] reductase
VAGRLAGRAAIIIGAAQGIGRGIAELFLEQGARVAIGDRKPEVGETTARELGRLGDVFFHQADVSSPESVKALVDAAQARFGRVDILVQTPGSSR